MPGWLCFTRSLTRQDGVRRDLEGTDNGQLCTRFFGFFAWSCHVCVHVRLSGGSPGRICTTSLGTATTREGNFGVPIHH